MISFEEIFLYFFSKETIYYACIIYFYFENGKMQKSVVRKDRPDMNKRKTKVDGA